MKYYIVISRSGEILMETSSAARAGMCAAMKGGTIKVIED